jgi:hydrogenase maturation protease
MNTLVIGIGNEFRCDDGVGLSVARRIAEQHIPGVNVLEENGEGTTLMDRWNGADAVIIIDAVSSGLPPGTLHRYDANTEDIPAQFFTGSTHSFGLGEAVQLSRVMHILPHHLIIYGIEGKHFSDGIMLTQAVEQSAGKVVDTIVAEIESLQHQNV